MNTAKIRKLADFIEARVDKKFDMVAHSTCILGFLAAMEGHRYYGSREACESLNLEYDAPTEITLFFGFPKPHPTREMAVATLRNFADTGQVVWNLQPVEAKVMELA